MIIILNFGSQYTHLIARRIRELGCYAEILPFDISSSKIKELKPNGLILSGSPFSVYDKNAPFPRSEIFSLNIPILGICYGQQIIAKMLGGEVRKGKLREFGREILTVLDRKSLFKGLNKKEVVWFSHGDLVTKPPTGFKIIGRSRTSKIASFVSNDNKTFGIQFHPEVIHTNKGLKILENFVYGICNEKKSWRISNIKNNLIAEIKKKVGNEAVLIGVSGGIDSLVVATLLKATVGDKLYCIFVETGLMRKNEAEEVEKIFKKMKFKNFIVADAKEEFFSVLKGVVDPEKKRKIIGHTFIRVFEKKTKELEKQAKFQFLEPIRELYKDEVRKLGKELGLSKSIIGRHPFPGPGLAVRILGEITKDRLDIVREADSIFISELKKANLYDKIWQAFAVLLPLKTVGIMGDARTYEYIISLRAVTSKDGMTADWA